MGAIWSSSGGDRLGSGSQQLRSGQQASTAGDPPLSLADIHVEPAGWDEDGFCRSVQRFLGFLPDSKVPVTTAFVACKRF